MNDGYATQPSKLGWELLDLLRYCETNCVAECCGIEAFDFSPIHMASWLLGRDHGANGPHGMALNEAIKRWRKECGIASNKGYTSDEKELGLTFSPQAVDALCDVLEANLIVAIELIRREGARSPKQTFQERMNELKAIE